MTDTREEKPADAGDIIHVREGEELPIEPLAEYLRGKLPGSEAPLEIVQFGGGHANLTYLIRFDGTEYVLRRPPIGPVAASAHDMGREYRALSALHRAYPPAPRAFLFCEDESVIGAPFFVMERRNGVVVRREIPERFGGGRDEEANRKMSEALIDALADLHDVDYASIGLDKLGKPQGFMQRQIDGWTRRWERSRTSEIPLVDELSRWLQENLPQSLPPTLLHNDWRLDNMMLDADDPGRVEAVFDWDMCTVGDPLADVGTLLSSWVEEGDSRMGVGTMPSNVPGFLSRRAAVERYGRRRGVDTSTVPYYYVFGLFKIAVVLQQIYYRWHVGQTKDERFQNFDQLVQLLMEIAHEQSKSPTL